MGQTRVSSKGVLPSGGALGQCAPGRLQPLRAAAALVWWPPGDAISLTSASTVSAPPLGLTFLLPNEKDPCNHSGPTRTLQDDLPSQNKMEPARSLLPRQVTHSQIPGARVWTSLEGAFFCHAQMGRLV